MISTRTGGDTAALLQLVKDTYDGDNKRLHLWGQKADGTFELDWGVNYLTRPKWKVRCQQAGS